MLRGLLWRAARGAGLGAILSVPVILLAKVAQLGAGLPFPPFDFFELATRLLPGRLIIFTIELMVSIITALGVGPTSVAAKAAEKGIAIIQFMAVCAALGALASLPRSGRAGRIGAGVLAGAVLAAMELASEFLLGIRGAGHAGGLPWCGALFIAWGALTGWSIVKTEAPAEGLPGASAGRRRFVWRMAEGVAVLSAALFGAVGWLGRLRPAAGAGSPEVPAPGYTSSAPANREGLLAPVHGTRQELDSNQDFFRIDIDLNSPELKASDWRLAVDGLVDNPLSLSLDDIRAMPAVSQYITLECISNPVGGDLIGTSRWTGVRLAEVLNRASIRPSARAILMEAADGYHESLDLKDAYDDRTLLVHAMNAKPLPREHGFPLRIYIQNRHGMKQPKWITRLTAAPDPKDGYWVERGWDNAAIVHTTSVIDAVSMKMMVGGAEFLSIGGMAYAGGRGISRVEVRADDGPWATAELISPPLSPLTWVLWRYQWPYAPGQHTFRVRAYDGNGDLQTAADHDPYPSGATGYHSKTVRV